MGEGSKTRKVWRPPSREKAVSPITRRILAVNVLALGILVAGLLYHDEYRQSLIDAEISSMETQAKMFAAALGETSVMLSDPIGEEFLFDAARQMVRRLVETTGARARLFGADGTLVADSRYLGGIRGPAGSIEVEILPLPEGLGFWELILRYYDRLAKHLPGHKTLPLYRESILQWGGDYVEVAGVLGGRFSTAVMVRRRPDSGLVLGVAVPVQHYKQVIGAIFLTKGSTEIDAALLDVRLNVLKLFMVALLVTTALSVYLARTIARPILRLAAAAERVRLSHHRQHAIPDFRGRGDEIEDLAVALRHMTEALWERMDAIDRFAADVSHEIKNPLTSLRSAVETAARLDDPDQQRKLMGIIQEDVQRLDRLITDISEASRLDAELSRAEKTPVNLSDMLATLVSVHGSTMFKDGLRLTLESTEGMMVDGMEDRLVRVFRNLIGNAVSFSPPDGEIGIRMGLRGNDIEVSVEDRGPGIPPGKEDAIFERFYTERPEGEKFGTHSGLGLGISRQIVEVHNGTLHAENRAEGGARFVVRIPPGKPAG